MVNVGVTQNDNGEFVWTCGCGEFGTPTKDREQARESFKEHRRSACTSQETVQTTPKVTEEVNTMEVLKEKATSKKKGGAKKSGANTRERAVTEKEALQVIEKIKAGKGTVMGEARRLGCYHATLRKALRAAVGEKAYAHLMSDKKGKKVSTSSSKKTAAAPAKKAGGKKAASKSAAKKTTTRKPTTRKKAADTPAPVETSVEPTVAAVETAAASAEAGV